MKHPSDPKLLLPLLTLWGLVNPLKEYLRRGL